MRRSASGFRPVGLGSGAIGYDGDGQGCRQVGVKPGTEEERERGEDIEPEEVEVEDEQGSLFELLIARRVPRHVENDIPLSGSAAAVLFVAREQTVSRLDCLGIPIAAGGPSVALFKLGQPIPGSKGFTAGSSHGTSPISDALSGRLGRIRRGKGIGKFIKGIRTPTGGPGTGSPLRFPGTRDVGRAVGRLGPFAGAAGLIGSAALAFHCTGQ